MKAKKKMSQGFHSAVATVLSRIVSVSPKEAQRGPFCSSGILYQPMRPAEPQVEGAVQKESGK